MTGLTLGEIRWLREVLTEYRPRNELDKCYVAELVRELDVLEERVEEAMARPRCACGSETPQTAGVQLRTCAACRMDAVR